MNNVYEMFGRLRELVEDPSITEIMVNGTRNVYIEKSGNKMKADVHFQNVEEIIEIIKTVFNNFNQRIDYYYPSGDICLDDGTRVNAVLPSIAQGEPAITIRKLSTNIGTIDDLVKAGSFTSRVKDFLIAAVKLKLNIIFSGGTGVGKTTLLKLLACHIYDEERLIIIEDAPELHLEHPNSVSLQTRLPDESGRGEVDLRYLIRNAMRMRPDRIILGEIRGQEALDTLQAMSTGHRGTLAIVHGSSPRGAVARLETLAKFSGIDVPSEEIKKLIASTVDIVVHMAQLRDGSRRVMNVSEVRGLDRGEIAMQDIYAFRTEGVDDNGKIKGKLCAAFKIFPAFFKEMERQRLVTTDIFKEDNT